MSYKTLLVSIFLTVAAQSGTASVLCSKIHSQQSKIDQIWRPTPRDTYMAIRANAPHYWAWSKGILPTLPKTLTAQGVVAGDGHLLNFGDIKLKDKIRFALIDLDDAGRGYLFFDFLRLSIANKAGRLEATQTDLFDAYVKGLRGEKIEKPDHIDDALDISEEKFEKKQRKYWEKHTENARFIKEDFGLLPLSRAKAETQAQFRELLKWFESEFDKYEILDTGYRIKEDGGSQGMSRLWILTQKDGDYFAFEFKEMSTPAVEQISKQLGHEARTDEVRETYWKGDQSRKFQVVKTKSAAFWMRPRYHDSLSQDSMQLNSAEDIVYIANYLGRMHGKQKDLEKYALALEQNRSLISKLTTIYISEVRRLQGN